MKENVTEVNPPGLVRAARTHCDRRVSGVIPSLSREALLNARCIQRTMLVIMVAEI